ncbi:MAG: nucleoside phosphorylase [Lentimicrobiaceae bacterium]|nr:nucleoside phosphorylase [Lentimicrobiaceae bacterium]
MEKIKESELIINTDGSIYHLSIHPENIADTIIVVGDPGRVEKISSHFQKIEFKKQNRELLTHTGCYNGKRLSVLSTGMGTDNLDIVINELDALVNIDLKKRIPKATHTSLNIIRLGTSGALQADIPVDSFIVSSYGLGLDGLLNFYNYNENINDKAIADAFAAQTGWNENLPYPYVVKASTFLERKIGKGLISGITATASGFYGPQGRVLRIPLAYPEMNRNIENFSYKGQRIVNFEMETSALYGLSAILGHQALTVCAVVANRVSMQFSTHHDKAVDELITLVLERLTE